MDFRAPKAEKNVKITAFSLPSNGAGRENLVFYLCVLSAGSKNIGFGLINELVKMIFDLQME